MVASTERQDFEKGNDQKINVWVTLIDKAMDVPLTYYFHQIRQEQNDHYRFVGLFVAFLYHK